MLTVLHGRREKRPTPGKRLFMGLVLGAGVLATALLAFFWIIPFVGLERIHPHLPLVSGVLAILFLGAMGWLALGLISPSIRTRSWPGSRRARGLAVRLLLPLTEFLGRVLRFSPEEVRHSFIKVNNDLVRQSTDPVPADKVLILLPHCLQASRCPRRLIHNPDNCTRCGQCVQGGLLNLRDAWGVHLAVATGGTIARRLVKELRPALIIACACERDLASGIQDTYPLPVFGVLNERPFGPCIDTTLNLDEVNAALALFVRPATSADSSRATGE